MIKKEFDKKEIRKFAITMSIALCVLGGLLIWRNSIIGFIFSVAGAAFLVLGLSVPQILYPVYRGWMFLARILGFVMTHLILTLVYYLLLMSIGLLMRAFKKIPLELKLEPNSSTYWRSRSKAESSADRYDKMF
jgi:hypothetical protein